MITPKEDAIIVREEDLANAYGEHLLIVGSDGKPEPGTDVPEHIFMRYEPTKNLLYIDTRVFKWVDLEETMNVWRKSQRYCGPMTKRMASGTGRACQPTHVVVFDLSEKPEERTAPIRPRRGKPLQVERVRAREAVAKKASESAFSLHRRMNELRAEYGKHPLFKEVEDILREARKTLEEANRLTTKGMKRGPAKGTKKKKHITQEERIRLDTIDAFAKENIHAIHRILKRFVVTGGKQKWEDKSLRPRLPEADWVGRYEEVSNEENGYTTKTLYIPVSVLKAMPELGEYTMDYRFVNKRYRRVGDHTAYCAVFDLGRRFIGVDT